MVAGCLSLNVRKDTHHPPTLLKQRLIALIKHESGVARVWLPICTVISKFTIKIWVSKWFRPALTLFSVGPLICINQPNLMERCSYGPPTGFSHPWCPAPPWCVSKRNTHVIRVHSVLWWVYVLNFGNSSHIKECDRDSPAKESNRTRPGSTKAQSQE